MKQLTIILLLSFLGLNAQTKVISGKIIDEHFNPLPNATIITLDSSLVAYADKKGLYTMTVPTNTKWIEVRYIAMETDRFSIKNKCEINIILLDDLIVEFETEKEHNRRLKKRRKQLSKLYKKAVREGIFGENKTCRQQRQ